jgi:hypothetical protein
MDGFFYGNSAVSGPSLIAGGEGNVDGEVHDPEIWATLSKASC